MRWGKRNSGKPSFTNYVSNGDATCTADGTKTAKCDRDGCSVTDTVTDEGSAGHHFTEEVKDSKYLKTAADCTNDAVYYKSCKCGEASVTETFKAAGTALGHKYTNYVSNDDAACTADGTKTAVCDNG